MTSHPSVLRDFSVDRRVWLLSAAALLIGAGAAALAALLLRCIALSTNFFYYHRFSFAQVSPADSPLGLWMALVPVAGGLLVGLMARYGSDKIRGHGIPEAIEAILLHGARVEPQIAVLKPISAAIAIGSGGPFGAEGPIIMTGGAFGSLVAQWMKLTDAERTTLLVAGAAAGMSATFAAPLAAVLLAVELLLFEWRPRSLVPVAFASATAAVLRVYLLGSGPIFAMPSSFTVAAANSALPLEALGIGLLVGIAATVLSRMMYGFEDLFGHFRLHWMWWPAIGGLGVGIGGIFFPRGLGVGYENIGELLRGNAPMGLILGLLIAKSLMWAFSLGSGTSGGVLAPILMIGGALGELLAVLAHASTQTQALCALVGMGAMLSGSLGVPLTAIVFSLELTHCLPAILPLTIACFAAHVVTSLVMPRSILTEKLGRRGFHLTREYGVDPLEMISVMEVMPEPDDEPVLVSEASSSDDFAFTDEPCREVAERMAVSGVHSMPVLDRQTRAVLGTVSVQDLLRGRRKSVQRESHRLRVFGNRKELAAEREM
jgi:chloride channel protein, CIC family